MNIGDYVRVENDKGALEGTVSGLISGENYYVNSVCGAVYFTNSPDQKITFLKTAEPMKLGTVVSVILKSDNRRYTAVRAENVDYQGNYTWYIPNGSGKWHAWSEFKDVEYV